MFGTRIINKLFDKYPVIIYSFLQFVIIPLAVQAQEANSFDILIPRNDYHLRGHLFEASGEGSFPIAILLQGIPGSESDVLGLGKKLSESGIHAFTFNYTGTHRSGGRWNSIVNDTADVRVAYEYILQPELIARYSIDTARVYLGGYSHGGGVALIYAANKKEVQRVFSIGGNDFGEWGRKTAQDTTFAQAVDKWFEYYYAKEWIRPADGLDRNKDLLENIDKVDVRRQAPKLAGKIILLIGGLDDQTTTIEDHMLPLYRALQQYEAKNVDALVYQTDHSFKNVKDKLAEDIVNWIKRN